MIAIQPPSVRGMGNAGGFQLEIEDRHNVGLNALQQATDTITAAANAEPGDADFRSHPDQILRMYTRNTTGGMVPLGSLMEVQRITGPDTVSHYNVYPAALIQGATLPGVSSGQAIEKMERLCRENLPNGFSYEWTQLTYQEVSAGNTAIFIFPLCVLFVFLASAAQYESWSLPLAVILIVPMCLLSAMAGVYFRHPGGHQRCGTLPVAATGGAGFGGVEHLLTYLVPE